MSRILVVDDDRILLRVYQSKLTKEGFEVDVAADGAVALEELHESPPDLILLDLLLPDMNGIEVIRRIRATERGRTIPIIVLSNVYLTEETDAALVAGANRILAKSVTSPRAVLDTIKELLICSEYPGIPASRKLPTIADPPVALPDISSWRSSEGMSPRSNASESPGIRIGQEAGTTSEYFPIPDLSLPAGQVESDGMIALTGQFLRGELFIERVQPALTEIKRMLGKSTIDPSLLPSMGRLFHQVGDHAVALHRWDVARLAAASESLVHQIRTSPDRLTASTVETIRQANERLRKLSLSAKACTDLTRVNVLVVDDDAVSRTLIGQAIRKVELRPVMIKSPVDALESLQQSNFQLILSDVSMLPMNGFQFAARVRQLPKYARVPIILVTAFDEFTAIFHARADNADDIIAKPFIPMELGTKALLHVLLDDDGTAQWRGSTD